MLETEGESVPSGAQLPILARDAQTPHTPRQYGVLGEESSCFNELLMALTNDPSPVFV